MKCYVVIETSICRDCEVPCPEASCVGVYTSQEEARKALKAAFDDEWARHEFPSDCWLWDCLAPEDSPDEVRIIAKDNECPERYWHIEEVDY